MSESHSPRVSRSSRSLRSSSALSAPLARRRALRLSAAAGLVLALAMSSCTRCAPSTTRCPLPKDNACTGQRFIGVINPAIVHECPTADGWTTRLLFTKSQSNFKLPPSLGQYCLYEWGGPAAKGVAPPYEACPPYGAAGPPAADITALKATANVTDIAEDCSRVVPLDYEANLRGSLRIAFGARAGAVSPLPSYALMSPVRIAVQDTSPDALSGGIPVGLSRHGDTVAHIARDLACPDSNDPTKVCAGHLATALALPRTDTRTVAPATGGYFGTLGELAESIRRTIDAWKTDVPNNTGEARLVINMSVGWDDVPGTVLCHGASPETNPNTLDSPARAVFHAVRNAACHGALLIAAAGNNTGGPTPSSGLVCPAHWESVPVPGEGVCLEETSGFEATYTNKFGPLFEGQSPANLRPPPNSLYNQIVYAVGGVDYGDAPLVMTRPQGRPRLAALALAGGAWDTSPSSVAVTQPPLLTGTSIAAAVVSGVAAAAWAYKPQLAASEILDVIYRSGKSLPSPTGLPMRADVCSAMPVTDCAIRRVSLCHALRDARIGVIPGACPDAAAAATSTTGQTHQNAAFTGNLLQSLQDDFGSITPTPVSLPGTSSIAFSLYVSTVAAPWTDPQPGWPVCPSCTLKIRVGEPIELYAKPVADIFDPVLIVLDENNSARSAPLLSAHNKLRSGVLHVFTISFTSGADPMLTRRAWISGVTTAGGQTSINQQILIAK